MAKSIGQLISQIRSLGSEARVVNHRGAPTPFPLRSEARPSVPWNNKVLEESLRVTLPSDLEQLWNQAASLRLFEDAKRGQWGLVLWTPDETLTRHRQKVAERKRDFRKGDLVIGEFLGDADLLVIRGDPDAPDFGTVLIALPLDSREDWDVVASSLSDFLDKYIAASGDKFWELR